MQEEKREIDLFLISGFLGSGKTTFLQHILEGKMGQRVGIIINEFGSVSIDGAVLKNEDLKLVEINHGSIFCACLKGGFVKTLAAFLQQPIDRLYVEASGMADPSSMEKLLDQMTPLLKKKYQTENTYCYRGSICIVDAVNFMNLSQCILPVVSQVKKSGMIVLNKIDRIKETERQKIHARLRELNPEAYIYDTSYARVPEIIVVAYLQQEKENVNETINTMENRPFCGNLYLPDGSCDETVRQFLTELSPKMMRMKGFYLSDIGKYMHVECVMDEVAVKETEEQPEINLLVLISMGQENLEKWIRACWEKYFPQEMKLEVE